MTNNLDLLILFLFLVITVIFSAIFAWMIVTLIEKNKLAIQRFFAKILVNVLHFFYVKLGIKIFAKQVKSLIYKIFGKHGSN